MDLQLSPDATGDRSATIYRELLEAILDGRLAAGERVPPSRELATVSWASRAAPSPRHTTGSPPRGSW